MSDYADLLFIKPVDDDYRPREIDTAQGLIPTAWVEPSGTQEFANKVLLLCRINTGYLNSGLITAALASSGHTGWVVAGVMDPGNGDSNDIFNMNKVKNYIADIEEEGESPRRPVVGDVGDFSIGWLGGVDDLQSVRSWE